MTFDLQEYWLKLERNHVSHNYRRYWVKWVKLWYEICENPEKHPTHEDLKAFRVYLRKAFDLKVWQENLAMQAIVLHFKDGSEFPIQKAEVTPQQKVDVQSGENSPGKNLHEIKSILHSVKIAMNREGFSRQTQKNYLIWINRFLRTSKSNFRDPRAVGLFISHMGIHDHYSPSSQNVALSAFSFLFRKVFLQKEVNFGGIIRTNRKTRIPEVLTVAEIRKLFAQMSGFDLEIARLCYGTGMRTTELHTLRLKDLNFTTKRITIRFGKGGKDRQVPIPEASMTWLKQQKNKVLELHREAHQKGRGFAPLDFRLHQKYPKAHREPAWQFLFPSGLLQYDEELNIWFRWHRSSSSLTKAIKKAVLKAGLTRNISTHTLRHSFATHQLQAGLDLQTLQLLMGHSRLETTRIYLHMEKMGGEIQSPLDRLNL